MKKFSGNQAYLKELNLISTLRLIRSKNIISRSEIADILGLNRSTITAVVNELIDQKLVKEIGSGTSKGGRPPKLLQFNPEAAYTVCVDLSSHHRKIFITNLSGKPYFSETVQFNSHEDPYTQIKKMIQTITKGLHKLPPKTHGLLGIGIGVPGVINNGIANVYTLNWVDVPLHSYFSDAFDCPIIISSDANAGLVAERYYGCAIDVPNFCYIKVGQSISAAVMLNNQIYQGYEFTGRVGHSIIDLNGRKCICGNHGCWEAYASETALINRYMEISGINNNSEMDIDKIVNLGKKNDPSAISAIHEFAEFLGVGISNIVNFLNPNLIVIGSNSFTPLNSIIYNSLNKVLQQNVLPFFLQKNIRISFSTLGENAICLGGAAMVVDKIFSSPNIKS